MDMLTSIKNFMIVFIVAVAIPVVVHLYISYFLLHGESEFGVFNWVGVYGDRNDIFIIVLILAVVCLLLGIFLHYPILKTAFTAGALLLLLYDVIFNSYSTTSSIKLIALTLWFIFLIILSIYYYERETSK